MAAIYSLPLADKSVVKSKVVIKVIRLKRTWETVLLRLRK